MCSLFIVWKPAHEQVEAVWTEVKVLVITHLREKGYLSKRELKIRNMHFTQKYHMSNI